MAEIHFKATKRKHSSGFAEIKKYGDLQFDSDNLSNDGIWLYPKNSNGIHERIFIDCNFKTKVFTLHFEDHVFKTNNLPAHKPTEFCDGFHCSEVRDN